MRHICAKLLTSTAAIVLAGLFFPSPALAWDNLQHGKFLNDAGNCALCHRNQAASRASSSAKKLSQTAFCYSCHGRDRSGSHTNVQDGKYSGGGGLRGGGFENAVMDTGLTGTPSGKPVTSAHDVGNPQALVWGGGNISSQASYGNSAALECSSCHNPHGNGNYRMLRALPDGTFDAETAKPVNVPDEDVPTYFITYDTATHYRDISYVPKNLDKWCAQCHTRYSAGPTGGVNSGDAVFTYRHSSESLSGGCLSCHVAHGSAATMGPHSGSVPWPDGKPGGGTKDSRLLQTDNRGVCLRCHTSADLAAN